MEVPVTPNLLVIYKAFCFEVAQSHMNEAPNEIQTQWFASLACKPWHHQSLPI